MSAAFLILTTLLAGSGPVFGQVDAALLHEAVSQTEAIRRAGADWPIHETRFFRIHHQPALLPAEVACTELDRFTAETAVKVGHSAATIAELEAAKLDYYLCDDVTVQELTGHPTKGMADLRGRAVISSHFPHFHELAHLLVDMTFAETPAQTLPVVQEGLACLLGGRWGRSPEVVLYTGWVNDHFGMGSLEDVLTQEAWNRFGGGVDVAYPLGTALCEAVRREAGLPGVMELNRRVAGSAGKVARLSDLDIRGLIAQICGGDRGQDLAMALGRVMADQKRCGILPGGEWRQTGPATSLETGSATAQVRKHKGGWIWKIRALDYPIFVLAEAGSGAARSPLFTEHLPGHTYHGERWGLRISPETVSFYDFGTNQLVGLWVAGFTEEPGGLDSPDGALIFRLAPGILPSGKPGRIVSP